MQIVLRASFIMAGGVGVALFQPHGLKAGEKKQLSVDPETGLARHNEKKKASSDSS